MLYVEDNPENMKSVEPLIARYQRNRGAEDTSKDPATAHIPVVALSSNAILRDIELGKEAGFFCYLTKLIMVNKFIKNCTKR